MESSKPALFVINRHSRRGQIAAAEARRALQQRGIEFLEQEAASSADIGAIIRSHENRAGSVILGGGDGTLHAAAAALVDTRLPLGILPLGTANDLARALEIPADIPAAIEIIAAGKTTLIDVGCVNDVHFFNVAHIGLGADLTRAVPHRVKRRWGVLGYAWRLLAALRDYRGFRAWISCDGQTRRLRVIEIAIGNGRHYGGGLTIAADATLTDHLLHVCALAPRPLWRMVMLAPALANGTLANEPGTLLTACRELEIHTRRRMVVDADGERVTATPARFRVMPDAVTVYTPPNGSETGEPSNAVD